MSEQFCLRWNNHQSTLISVFETLLESGSLIDCTLCAEGQLLKGHKVVLSACSPIFESMLCVQEDKHPIIFLRDVKFIELKAMLDYMYKGEVNILQDQLDSFLRTAAALQIKGLTDQGGGGGDEPPAKKGPGRKTGMSDVAPESPLVGNAPLREGSVSPTRRRRRLPRRPSSAEDASADNSCDIPPPAVAPPAITPATQTPTHTPLPVAEPLHRQTVKAAKQEPIDPPLVPKQEYVEETNEEIEDLTLDDDDDYNDSMSDMSKPGTSFMNPGSTSQQDFSQWQQMMGAADRSGTDEVFMAAQEAINNQTNTQGNQQTPDGGENGGQQSYEANDRLAMSPRLEDLIETVEEIIKSEKEEGVAFSNNESDQQDGPDCLSRATALSDKELERIFGPSEPVSSPIESFDFVSEKCTKSVKTNRRLDGPPSLRKLLSTPHQIPAPSSGIEASSSQTTPTTETTAMRSLHSITVVPTVALQEPVCHETVSMPVCLPVHFPPVSLKTPPTHVDSPPKRSKISMPSLTPKVAIPKLCKQKTGVCEKSSVSFKDHFVPILPKPPQSENDVPPSPRSLPTSPSQIHVSPTKITLSCTPDSSNISSPVTPVYVSPTLTPSPSLPSASKITISSSQIFSSPTLNPSSIAMPPVNTLRATPGPSSIPSPVNVSSVITQSLSMPSASKFTFSSTQLLNNLVPSITPSSYSNQIYVSPTISKPIQRFDIALSSSPPVTRIYVSPKMTLSPSMPSARKITQSPSQIFSRPTVNPSSVSVPPANNITPSYTPDPLKPSLLRLLCQNPSNFPSPVASTYASSTVAPSPSPPWGSKIIFSSSHDPTNLVSPITPSSSKVSLLKPKVYKNKQPQKRNRLLAKKPPWASS